jgi:serine/threonine-protein kinase
MLASAQGTYAFIAPEVLRGVGCSRAGDVWAVATIAYVLLTDHLPFVDGGAFEPLRLTRFRRPLLPPSSYNETVDADLDEIVLAALEVDHNRRTPSARELLDALEARSSGSALPPSALNTTGGHARPPSERARRLVDEARALARTPGELPRAADLLEEAVGLSSQVRERHLETLILWRRGVLT